MKKVYQYMAFERQDGKLTVRNKYFHKPLKGYTLYLVSLTPGSGHAVERVPLPEVAPGKSVTVSLPSAAMKSGSLMVLADARYKLPEDVKMLSASQLEHVVDECEAYEWFPAPADKVPAVKAPASLPAVSVRKGNPLVVQGKGFTATFKDGMLSALRYGGQDLILPDYPVTLQAYRSPVDNDSWIRSKVEGKMKMQNMKMECSDVQASVISPGVARVTAEFKTKGSELSLSGRITWTVFGNGIINASARIYPSAKGEELLRLGFTFGMPAAYDQVEYLGLGPWDNYRDRRTSCWKDLFRTSVDDMFFAYSRPQDMGNRMETDWVALSKDKSAPALWVGAASPGAPLEVSILRYTPRELNNAKSLDKLPEKNKVIVNLDAFQMGLGGSSCGPRPLVKYQTLSEATPLGFVLAPASGLLNLARSGLLVPHSPVIERDGDGMVSLSSSTPGVEMKYSVNKGPEKVYKKPFKLPEGNVRAWAAAGKPGSAAPTSPDERQFPLIKGQAEWKILSASSEEPDTGFAHFAIDGKPDTYWHTSYTNGLPGFPHSIAVDMGTRMKFTGFIYTPRMDKDKGLISQYAFSISDDGKNWKEVKKGQFTYHYIRKDPAVQRIDFGKPVEARYFKLDAKSPVRSGEQSATVAELNIITQ